MIFLKKTLILIFLALIIIILCQNKSQKVIIPKESIRIRIIANSNNNVDINQKLKVKKEVETKIYELLEDVKTLDEARTIINNNLDNLNISLEDSSVSFGYNYFPKKVYKDIIYEEGMYESLVITLGKGEGDNWWCVLFPPLCLLEENENTKDVEYHFLVKDIIDKYIKNPVK